MQQLAAKPLVVKSFLNDVETLAERPGNKVSGNRIFADEQCFGAVSELTGQRRL